MIRVSRDLVTQLLVAQLGGTRQSLIFYSCLSHSFFNVLMYFLSTRGCYLIAMDLVQNKHLNLVIVYFLKKGENWAGCLEALQDRP